MLDNFSDILLNKLSLLTDNPQNEDLNLHELPDGYEPFGLHLQALKYKLDMKDRQFEHLQFMLTSLMLDIRKWVIVLEIDTGNELFLNNTARFIMKGDKKFADILHTKLSDCRCNVNNPSVFWEYTYENEINQDNKMYYTINSFYIPWGEKLAVAHVINDNTASRRVEIEMQTIAFKDSLTDLYNRRYAMKLLEEWYSEKVNFCISFIDIDYLKYCNDVFGHEEGNTYILLVTEHLNQIPEEKTFCRIGGDEFMIIKRDVSTDEMDERLAVIREQLTSYHHETINYRRSYSYGSCITDYENDVTLDKILRTADQRMYKFKYANKQK